MARRLALLSVLAISLGGLLWTGRATVDAQPKPGLTLPACRSELVRTKTELASAREAVRRAEAAEAAARAELEQMRAAERARLKRLEEQTGVAADRLR
jgi:hypothetical protein